MFSKLVFIILIGLGLVLVTLGYAGAFTFGSCPSYCPGGRCSCINASGYDILAIQTGGIVSLIGAWGLVHKFLVSRK